MTSVYLGRSVAADWLAIISTIDTTWIDYSGACQTEWTEPSLRPLHVAEAQSWPDTRWNYSSTWSHIYNLPCSCSNPDATMARYLMYESAACHFDMQHQACFKTNNLQFKLSENSKMHQEGNIFPNVPSFNILLKLSYYSPSFIWNKLFKCPKWLQLSNMEPPWQQFAGKQGWMEVMCTTCLPIQCWSNSLYQMLIILHHILLNVCPKADII